MLDAKDYAQVEYWRKGNTSEDLVEAQESIKYWGEFQECVDKGELWGSELDEAEIAEHKAHAKQMLKKLRNRVQYLRRRRVMEKNRDNLTECVVEVIRTCKEKANANKQVDVEDLMQASESHTLHQPRMLSHLATVNLKRDGYTITF